MTNETGHQPARLSNRGFHATATGSHTPRCGSGLSPSTTAGLPTGTGCGSAPCPAAQPRTASHGHTSRRGHFRLWVHQTSQPRFCHHNKQTTVPLQKSHRKRHRGHSQGFGARPPHKAALPLGVPRPADSAAPGIQADPQLWVRGGDEATLELLEGPTALR